MHKKLLLVFFLLSPTITRAGSISGVLDTAVALKPNAARTSLEVFSAFNAGGQINPIIHFDYGLIKDLDINAFLGTGTVEFQFGAGAQYTILPDVPGQIAVSASTNFRYALDHISIFLWEVYPTVSKKFRYKLIDFTPYLALPFGVAASKVRDTAEIAISLGSEIDPIDFKTLTFFSEFGFNLYRSSWSFSIQASLDFDNIMKFADAPLP